MSKDVFKGAFRQRLRHRKGHGVHSPFVYSLIRNVFMNNQLPTGTNHIYNTLIEKGIKHKYAVRLQNLHTYCSYQELIAADGTDMAELRSAAKKAEGTGQLLIVFAPLRNDECKTFCNDLALSGKCLSIYKKGYMLFFFDDKLPKQHFNL